MADAEILRLLEEALRIRRTQQHGAELTLARARARAREQAERVAAQEQLLAGLQEGWAASVQGGGMDVTMAKAWAEAIGRGEVELAFRTKAAGEAERQQVTARGDLATAISRVEATAGLARSASQRIDRSRDEASLAASDDRNAWSRGAR